VLNSDEVGMHPIYGLSRGACGCATCILCDLIDDFVILNQKPGTYHYNV